jgi:hypothetical protein
VRDLRLTKVSRPPPRSRWLALASFESRHRRDVGERGRLDLRGITSVEGPAVPECLSQIVYNKSAWAEAPLATKTDADP